MKQFLKKRWVVPIGALVFTLAIGSAAFAATGSSSTATSTSGTGTNAAVSSGKSDAAATQMGPHGRGGDHQRSDETPLTGDTLAKAEAAALAEVGSDATVMRAETDADGNAKYEVHVKKADGTMVTVYLDESFNVVKTEEGCIGGGRARDRDRDGSCPDQPSSTSTSTSSTSANIS